MLALVSPLTRMLSAGAGCEGGIRSISRYFATVRRASSMPSSPQPARRSPDRRGHGRAGSLRDQLAEPRADRRRGHPASSPAGRRAFGAPAGRRRKPPAPARPAAWRHICWPMARLTVLSCSSSERAISRRESGFSAATPPSRKSAWRRRSRRRPAATSRRAGRARAAASAPPCAGPSDKRAPRRPRQSPPPGAQRA